MGHFYDQKGMCVEGDTHDGGLMSIKNNLNRVQLSVLLLHVNKYKYKQQNNKTTKQTSTIMLVTS